MQAYLNDHQLKSDLLEQVAWHREQDMIVQGTYGEFKGGKWRGCAVGCSIDSLNRLKGKRFETDDHSVYESELGIPEWLARLEDRIFEGLPKDKALDWPLRFATAIPVGADLEPVKWRFCAFLLSENIERVLNLDIADDLKKQVVDAIRGVLTLHEQAIKTGEWNESAAWSAAESAESAAWSAESARSAAESAAWSAAESAAWSAWSARSAAGSAAESARSAAWSAWSAAESAAWSAAWSAWSAAESAAYEKYADKLVELLEATDAAL